MAIIDDFEDGDVDGWDGDTGFFSASTSVPAGMGGAYVGALDSDPDATANFTSVSKTFDNTTDQLAFSIHVDEDPDGGRSEAYTLQGRSEANGLFIRVKLMGSGDIDASNGGTGEDTGLDWIGGQTYDVRINFDYDNNQYDLYVDGQLVVSGWQFSAYEPTASSLSGIKLMNDPADSGPKTVKVDDIRTIPQAVAPTLSVSNTSAGQADLSWTDEGLSSYTIYRAESSGSTLSDYTQVDSVSGSTTTYSDTGLEDGERYYYVVTSTSEVVDETGPSNEVNATTPLLAPSAPTIDDSVEDELTLSWSNNDNSTDGDIVVYRSQDGTLGTSVATLSPSTATYTDTGLEDGERYYYTVRRETDHATADGEADAVALLPAPGVTLDTSTEDEITIGYTVADDSPEGTLTIYRSTDGTLGTELTSTSTLTDGTYTDTGLVDGERYYYTLERSTDHATAQSGQADAVTLLPAPTGLVSNAIAASEADLEWTDNHGNGETEVQYKPTSDGSWTTFSALAIGTESEVLTGLRNGEMYDLRVVATTEDATTEDV